MKESRLSVEESRSKSEVISSGQLSQLNLPLSSLSIPPLNISPELRLGSRGTLNPAPNVIAQLRTLKMGMKIEKRF